VVIGVVLTPLASTPNSYYPEADTFAVIYADAAWLRRQFVIATRLKTYLASCRSKVVQDCYYYSLVMMIVEGIEDYL
jgi:hypothetical protein